MSLAALVTEDLQAVNGDKHLRLLYSAEEVPDESDDSAEMAAMARYAELHGGGIAGVRRLDGNVGYLELRPILFPPLIAGAAATAAMSVVAQADVLIVDLRQCRGGDPEMVALLCSYLFDEPVHLTDTFERAGNQTRQSWTLPYTPGRKFGGAKPVYVLTSATTFSAGEEFSYDLQQLGRATMVGEREGRRAPASGVPAQRASAGDHPGRAHHQPGVGDELGGIRGGARYRGSGRRCFRHRLSPCPRPRARAAR